MYGLCHIYQWLQAECDASHTAVADELTYTNSLLWKHLKAVDYDVSEWRGVNIRYMYFGLLWT